MNLRQKLTQRIHALWLTPGLPSTLLLPLSWLVLLFVRIKGWRYRRRPAARPAQLPVIIVGNLMVGGTGKTPIVIALVQGLQKLGWKPGVISRGYGAHLPKAQARCGIAPLNPAEFGDEPSLIAAATGVPVAVHPRRNLALATLHAEWPDVDIVVSDDGLQHLALARDFEIVVQDARGLGNGRVLPAGPLREPLTRLKSVNLIMTHMTNAGNDEAVTNPHRFKSQPGLPTSVPVIRMQLQPVSCTHLVSGEIVPWQRWRQNHLEMGLGAVAAIGQPERFFGMLRRQGLVLEKCIALPDHDTFLHPPFRNMSQAVILVTDKDAVKCQRTNDARLWSVQVTPRFSEDNWVQRVHEAIKSLHP